jgi:predicted metal-dependent enzyme (double-stranded beta helix superfamily)
MALVSVLPRAPHDPLPADVLADLATRAARRIARSRTDAVAPPSGRWDIRLRVTDHYDVWLIGWGTDSKVELHDHGPSAGSIAVVHGALVEHTPLTTGGHRRQRLEPGRAHAFGPGHLHDVVNEGPEVAISAHVYSPPLTSMTFYDDDRSPLRTDSIDLPGLVVDR